MEATVEIVYWNHRDRIFEAYLDNDNVKENAQTNLDGTPDPEAMSYWTT